MVERSSRPGIAPVERLIRHDKAIVLACAGVVVLVALAYTVAGVGMNMSAIEMTRMARPIGAPMQMGAGPQWTPLHATLIFLMWWIMMIAMMTPSAAPTLLLYTAVKRMGAEAGSVPKLSMMFLGGYLVAWAAFSVAATGAQWALESLGLSDGPMMTVKSRGFAGVVLVLAGLYQFSALKQSCLRHCRSPAQFLAGRTYPGASGAFRLGIEHGAYCLGCCWALMALLFVGGVMNLYWIAGIAAYVALEKLLPRAGWLVPLSGGVLIVAGAYLIVDVALG